MVSSLERGFTLIEIMVVLIVIGLCAGLAYARYDANPRQAIDHEARLFAAALEHAAQLAQWRSETVGVSAEGGAYRFWQRAADDRWAALGDDEVLRPHALSEGLFVSAREYGGQAVAPDVIVPLRPSGRNEPYVFEVSSPDWRVDLSSDVLNRMVIVGPSPR
jgi:general secretion pathway protein H